MKRAVYIKACIIISVALVFAGAITIHKKVQAILPFGGMILIVKACECPVPGFLLTVSGPVGGLYLFPLSGAMLFANYNIITPGAWVLGLHTGTPVGCGNFEKGFCAAQVPAQGIITMVGTS